MSILVQTYQRGWAPPPTKPTGQPWQVGGGEGQVGGAGRCPKHPVQCAVYSTVYYTFSLIPLSCRSTALGKGGVGGGGGGEGGRGGGGGEGREGHCLIQKL